MDDKLPENKNEPKVNGGSRASVDAYLRQAKDWLTKNQNARAVNCLAAALGAALLEAKATGESRLHSAVLSAENLEEVWLHGFAEALGTLEQFYQEFQKERSEKLSEEK